MIDPSWVLFVSLWASVQTLAVMYLFTNGRLRAGCALSLANQIPWVLLAILAETYGTFLLSAAMAVLAIRGWRKWS